MTPQFVATVIAAIITAVVPGVIALRQARRAGRATERLDAKKVDAEAYDRARTTYESSIKQLNDAVDRCEKAFRQSRREGAQLRHRVRQLEGVIRDLGGAVPREVENDDLDPH